MKCMKCGKELKTEDAFCPHCLEEMEKYPVKPDVHIQLPNRSASQSQKRSNKKRAPSSADEQIPILESRVRALTTLAVLLIILLGALIVVIFYQMDGDFELPFAVQQPITTLLQNCFT